MESIEKSTKQLDEIAEMVDKLIKENARLKAQLEAAEKVIKLFSNPHLCDCDLNIGDTCDCAVNAHLKYEKLKAGASTEPECLTCNDTRNTGREGRRINCPTCNQVSNLKPYKPDNYKPRKAGAGSASQEESPRRISKGSPSRLAGAGINPATPQACKHETKERIV